MNGYQDNKIWKFYSLKLFEFILEFKNAFKL